MRLSARRNDPGYKAYINMISRDRDVAVLLNGVEQDAVVTADEERGYVLLHVLDSDGKP